LPCFLPEDTRQSAIVVGFEGAAPQPALGTTPRWPLAGQISTLSGYVKANKLSQSSLPNCGVYGQSLTTEMKTSRAESFWTSETGVLQFVASTSAI